jgi:Pentapeptide repeats (8 copies)
MANEEHVALLKQGVAAWNTWRAKNPDIRPDLTKANLSGEDLREADFRDVNLRDAVLRDANFSGADLRGAAFIDTDLSGEKTDLRGADLRGAHFKRANLREADLRGANLDSAALVVVDLTDAKLTGCRVFGISAWRLKLEGTEQQNLIVTSENEPTITVDNIEVAQFIYLMLNNKKVRGVIDTITSKVVLILGRFTEERKAVLDALREELRKRDYLPIMFDFAAPAARDTTETISLLGRMSRFIIADLTDPLSVPKELEAIIPDLAVPVQSLLEAKSTSYGMFKNYWKYDWVLPVYRYEGVEALLAALAEKVIAPAEGKAKALEERRRLMEAQLKTQ